MVQLRALRIVLFLILPLCVQRNLASQFWRCRSITSIVVHTRIIYLRLEIRILVVGGGTCQRASWIETQRNTLEVGRHVIDMWCESNLGLIHRQRIGQWRGGRV